MVKSTFLFLMFLLFLPLASFSGSFDCVEEEDFNEERFQTVQTKNIAGYRFDITKPPVYAKNISTFDNMGNPEGCKGDSYILVRDATENVVFFKQMYLPLRFAKLDKYEIKQPKRIDVAILQHSGGVSCCGYLHLFQVKPTFKYLGQQEVPL